MQTDREKAEAKQKAEGVSRMVLAAAESPQERQALSELLVGTRRLSEADKQLASEIAVYGCTYSALAEQHAAMMAAEAAGRAAGMSASPVPLAVRMLERASSPRPPRNPNGPMLLSVQQAHAAGLSVDTDGIGCEAGEPIAPPRSV